MSVVFLCAVRSRYSLLAQGHTEISRMSIVVRESESRVETRPGCIRGVGVFWSCHVLHGGLWWLRQVSSTRIRACLAEGNTEEVHSLLGRPHRCLAEVPVESGMDLCLLTLDASGNSRRPH